MKLGRRGFFGTVAAAVAGLWASKPESEVVTLEPTQPSLLSALEAGEYEFDEELYPSIDLVTEPTHEDDPLICVGNPEFFREGDVAHIHRTGETVLVKHVGDRGIVAIRGFSGHAQPVIADDSIWILGSAEHAS